MTPEQRETLELLVFERESRKFHGLGDRVINARELDALRAALAPPPTCGTCKWGVEVFTEHAPPDEVFCQRFSGRRKRDDGCIKGYTPKEPTR